MELKTQALDRLLEALSPALAAELDRVVNETRLAVEQDVQKRVQAAVREAESAVRSTLEGQLQRAISDAREATRRLITEELEKQFKKTLEETTDQLNSEAFSERTRLQQQLDQWRIFADAQRQMGEAASQPEILARFLKVSEAFSGALAVYVLKADGLALWKSRGKAAFPEIISEETTDPESYFRTVMVRGKTIAAVCGAQPYKSEALDYLVGAMERAIEIFGLRLRFPLPKQEVAPAPVAAATGNLKPEAAGNPEAAGSPEAVAAAVVDDPKQHAEARRTARLIISEIKLYNEEELKTGRANRDIYERLQKEIDQGRETYRQRVAPAVLSSRDYFHEELVRILGENDVAGLGTAYPGPRTS